MNCKLKSRNYFKYFNNQDVIKLSRMFDENIVLVDWVIKVTGKSKVIEANKNIFKKFKKIKVKIKKMLTNKNIVIAELEIKLSSKLKINVVDILEFNEFGKLKKITAFKR